MSLKFKMKYYQLAYLLSPQLNTQELQEIEKEITSYIEKEGILDKVENPLKRNLFYPIKKFKEAFLGSIYFFLEPAKLKDFEKKIKKEERILRFLITVEKSPKELPKEKKIRKPKKVEIEDLDKKLEEILGQ